MASLGFAYAERRQAIADKGKEEVGQPHGCDTAVGARASRLGFPLTQGGAGQSTR